MVGSIIATVGEGEKGEGERRERGQLCVINRMEM